MYMPTPHIHHQVCYQHTACCRATCILQRCPRHLQLHTVQQLSLQQITMCTCCQVPLVNPGRIAATTAPHPTILAKYVKCAHPELACFSCPLQGMHSSCSVPCSQALASAPKLPAFPSQQHSQPLQPAARTPVGAAQHAGGVTQLRWPCKTPGIRVQQAQCLLRLASPMSAMSSPLHQRTTDAAAHAAHVCKVAPQAGGGQYLLQLKTTPCRGKTTQHHTSATIIVRQSQPPPVSHAAATMAPGAHVSRVTWCSRWPSSLRSSTHLLKVMVAWPRLSWRMRCTR